MWAARCRVLSSRASAPGLHSSHRGCRRRPSPVGTGRRSRLFWSFLEMSWRLRPWCSTKSCCSRWPPRGLGSRSARLGPRWIAKGPKKADRGTGKPVLHALCGSEGPFRRPAHQVVTEPSVWQVCSTPRSRTRPRRSKRSLGRRSSCDLRKMTTHSVWRTQYL